MTPRFSPGWRMVSAAWAFNAFPFGHPTNAWLCGAGIVLSLSCAVRAALEPRP